MFRRPDRSRNAGGCALVREGELEPSGEYAIGAPRSLADCVRGEIFASQVRMILIEFVHGCHTARKGCHTPPSRVKTLLETPETQTRALPSLVRIRISYARA